MLEKVDLILEVFRKLSHRIVLPNVDSSVASRGDVVKVTGACVKSCKNQMQTRTYCLSAERMRVVLSLKCTPTDPSVRA
jgi:hypothetical protein